MTATRTRRVEVAGAALEVVVVGPEGGRPLLVVHGGPGEGHDALRPHLDALATTDRAVVYFDQRDAGRSSVAAPERVVIADHVRDLEAVRASVGAASVDVLGFSWGATLAALWALAHRDAVRALVLVSPAPPPNGPVAPRTPTAEAVARAERFLATYRTELAGAPDAEARTRFASRIAPYLSRPEVVRDLRPVDRLEHAGEAAFAELGRRDLARELEALRGLPITIVAGADDPISAAWAPLLEASVGGRLHLLDGSGHAPFAEVPGPFLSAVRAALA